LGYYKVHNETKTTWQGAWQTCRHENSHLAVVNSPEEAEFLATLSKKSNTESNYLWIGFHGWYTDWITIFGKFSHIK
jgi:Lectin C-type domain.